MADDHKLSEGFSIDYKTLFLGACAVISMLSSLVYGFWTSRTEQATEDSRTTNELQWQRLQQLSDKLLEQGAQLQQLRREADDKEERLREIERGVAREQRERRSH